MKKILLIFTIILSFVVYHSKAHAVYWDIRVDEMPLMIVYGETADMNTPENTNSYYTFFNIANIGLNFYFDDDAKIQFRVKYTYMGLTNSTSTNPHKIYIDKLSFNYEREKFGLLAGRDLFVEGNGMLVGNVADGLRVRASFLGFNPKLYVYYSGLLPNDVNDFNANTYDKLEGAERLAAGFTLQKYGLGLKSAAITFLYMKDLSTNTADNSYEPMYLGLNGNGSIKDTLSYGFSFAYQFGQSSGTVNISAIAFDISLSVLLSKKINLAAVAKFAYAGGDTTNDTTVSQNFRSFGIYDTGATLNPDFSNLMIVQLGLIGGFFKDKLSVQLNYYYLARISGNDSVNGDYIGTGTDIGNEISGDIRFKIDPNFSVFLTGGYCFGGSAISDKGDVHKTLAGITMKF